MFPQPEIVCQFFRDVDRAQRLASFPPIAQPATVHRFPEQALVIIEIAPAQSEQFTRTQSGSHVECENQPLWAGLLAFRDVGICGHTYLLRS